VEEVWEGIYFGEDENVNQTYVDYWNVWFDDEEGLIEPLIPAMNPTGAMQVDDSDEFLPWWVNDDRP